MTTSVNQQAYYIGNSAFEKDLGSYTMFPTRSDAMIASLALAHDASPDLMDAIFSILRDRSFNPSEMVLHRTEDIYLYQSKRSFASAVTGAGSTLPVIGGQGAGRSEFQFSDAPNPIPPLVLGEVIGWIEEVIQDRHRPFEERCDLKDILRSLALVQHRWTHPARRALGRSLVLTHPGRKELLKHCLASPFVGPWTRRFYLNSSKGPEIDLALSTAGTLKIALTDKLTGIRKFVWTFDKALLSTDLFRSTLGLLSSVNELVLVFASFPVDSDLSTSHFGSIISMPSLRNLTLKRWDVPDISCQGLPLGFAVFRPSPSLQALHLFNPMIHAWDDFPKGVKLHPVWTRDQSGDFFLSTFAIHFQWGTEADIIPGKLHRLSPLLLQLETLYVAGVPDSKQECVSWLLERCPKTLRGIFLESEPFLSAVTLRCVPRGVERLSFQFGNENLPGSRTQWEDVDALLFRLISANIWPELRALRIYFRQKVPYGTIATFHIARMHETEALCTERHINFIISLCTSRRSKYSYENINEFVGGLDILHDLGKFTM